VIGAWRANMPTRKKKACPRCGKTIDASQTYCEKHKKERAGERAEYLRKKDAQRANSNSRGYNYKWQQARASFLRKYPYCDCGAKATVVDHIIPHRGDMKLFWDKSNWQPLCKKCHDAKTARGE